MKFFLKLVISGGLISWVLIYKINWLDFRTIMQQTNIWLLIIAFCCILAVFGLVRYAGRNY